MRLPLALLLVLSSFNLSASTIDRIVPQSIPADTAEHSMSIYGFDLKGPVIFSSPAGDFAMEVEGGGSFIRVSVPAAVHQEPGEVRITVNDATAILTVTPLGPPPLQLQGGDPVVIPAEGRWGARVEYDVWAIGGRDPNPTVVCDPPSGSTFPLGPSHVRCAATNSFGERAEGGKYIFVADYGVPVLHLPDRIRVEATSPEGAHVQFTATATDGIDGEVPVECTPKSGSLFPAGETEVQCVAYDKSLNPASGSFIVEVVAGPKEVLVLHLPDPVVAEAMQPGGAEVTFTVTADGTSDPRPTIVCDPRSGSLFPLGVTTVQCVATDSAGNRAEGSFTVTVQDTVGPLISSVTATPDEVPPNMKWVEVQIAVEATDVVDPMPRCSVIEVFTNQPGGGSRISGELTVGILADRDPKLGDRIYHIRVECRDAAQNTSAGFPTVVVPKGNPDDGTSQPVTTPEPPPKKRRSVRG